MKNTGLFALLVFAAMLSSCCGSRRSDGVKTTFQTSREWRPTIDNRADAAMVYGVGGNPSDNSDRIPFEERVRSWRERGYEVHFMTGIAWGEYQDYFTGAWDGVPHLDEGQVQRSGDTIWHGHMVPYIVPTDNYLEYMKQRHIKRVIDAGITHIFLEEPEFWARAGYSEAFKREWRKFYGFDWRPQHESPENTYLASKLKYHLYYNALREVCSFAKEYGRSKGLDVRCYVPTHSLVNYAQWQIVSPEASLASLPCVDGYIAQVWTGTSREPNYFDGVCRERVFETAFLEYGSMASMTAPTSRKMFFLTDPIEDWPRDWKDYKRNYQATFVAQLLYPGIADYEVMPWPERIYEGLYRTSPDSDAKERIPRRYSAQMQVMIGALHSMPRTGDRVSGSHGIAVAMSNSLMFQRFPRHDGYDDPQLANFYGLALPFVKRGVPVATVHLENLAYPEALADTKVLLMTYSNMKPQEEASHEPVGCVGAVRSSTAAATTIRSRASPNGGTAATRPLRRPPTISSGCSASALLPLRAPMPAARARCASCARTPRSSCSRRAAMPGWSAPCAISTRSCAAMVRWSSRTTSGSAAACTSWCRSWRRASAPNPALSRVR